METQLHPSRKVTKHISFVEKKLLHTTSVDRLYIIFDLRTKLPYLSTNPKLAHIVTNTSHKTNSYR